MTTAAKTKPTKAPGRKVVADDLVVNVNGVDYWPHQGETVEFRTNPSVSDSMVFMRYVALGRNFNSEGPSSAVEELEAVFDKALAILARHISSWDWTDSDGNAYPNPPTVEELRPLEPLELMWLIGALNATQAVSQGEGSSSTSP